MRSRAILAARRLVDALSSSGSGSSGRVVLSGAAEDAAIAEIRLCNASKRNAFSATMVSELAAHVDTLESWCSAGGAGGCSGVGLLLRGEGGFFCSGMDLNLASALPRADALAVCAVMADSLSRLRSLPLVSVAAVEGGAFGGGAEAMTACDHRVLAADATVRFVHARMGLSPGWGGAGRLARLVGRQHALRLLTTAAPLDAPAALAMGLVDAVAGSSSGGGRGGGGGGSGGEPHGEPGGGAEGGLAAVADARQWLESVAQFPPDVIRANKAAVVASFASEGGHAEEAALVERQVFCGLWGGAANAAALSKVRAPPPNR
jgi:ethylmalonyl-CoA/methylmalonyl-CoA decarboxylase